MGVSRFDERPEVSRLPRVGGFVDPSVEAVLALHPDLVLAQPGPGNRRAVETMAGLGAPVLLLPLGTVADVLAAERAVGKALGRAEQGEALARALESTRARIRGRARAERPVRVLLVYGFEPLVVAGPGGFADELLADAGASERGRRRREPLPGLLGRARAPGAPGARPRRGEHSGGQGPAARAARTRARRAGRRFRISRSSTPGRRSAAGSRSCSALVHPEAAP